MTLELNEVVELIIFLPRSSCPDISIPDLAAGDGQGFIVLVRQIVQSARHFDPQQDYFPTVSETFDKFLRIERNLEREALPLDRGIRTYQSMHQQGEPLLSCRLIGHDH